MVSMSYVSFPSFSSLEGNQLMFPFFLYIFHYLILVFTLTGYPSHQCNHPGSYRGVENAERCTNSEISPKDLEVGKLWEILGPIHFDIPQKVSNWLLHIFSSHYFPFYHSVTVTYFRVPHYISFEF